MFVKYVRLSIIIILVVIVLLFIVKVPLHNKVIGIIGSSGLQGEFLFERNIIYNFEKGNLFKYFNTDYLNYPFGENLGFGIANSLHLFLYIPLKFFLGLIESYNAAAIIIFFLNILSAYILARYLFSSKPIALACALIFAVNPYVFLKMNLGFMQKYVLFWIPLYFLFLFKLQNAKKIRYAFYAGAMLCFMQLTYPPYAYFAVMFSVFLLIYLFFRHDELWFALPRFILIIALFLITTSVIYYFMGFGFVYFEMSKPCPSITLDGCLDLFRPFRFYPYHSFSYPVRLPLGISLSASLLGIYAAVKKRGLPRLILFILISFVIIAAGSYLTYGGEAVRILGHRIILPFYLITKYLPFAGEIFFPIRIFPFINSCLAILAGYGLSYIFSYNKVFRASVSLIPLIIFIYLLEQAIFYPELFPPRISGIQATDFYREIKEEDFKALLNLPISSDRRIINRYGYYAALSNKKIMNPYDKDSLQIHLPQNNDALQIKKDFIRFLFKWGVGYIVIHKEFMEEDYVKEFSWLSDFCTPAIYQKDNLTVYKIPLSHTRQSNQY